MALLPQPAKGIELCNLAGAPFWTASLDTVGLCKIAVQVDGTSAWLSIMIGNRVSSFGRSAQMAL